MPHYKDGTEGKLRDTVMGQTYNMPYPVIGVVVNIREGDSCNMDIAFSQLVENDYDVNVMAISCWDRQAQKSYRLPIGIRTDAGAMKDFTLLHRPKEK
jgi:hypothetical protein